MENKVKIKRVAEIIPAIDKVFQLPRLSSIIDKEIIITDVRIDKAFFGEYAVIYTKDGASYVTSSKVVLKQLAEVKKYIDKNKLPVAATVRKKRNYYYLE